MTSIGCFALFLYGASVERARTRTINRVGLLHSARLAMMKMRLQVLTMDWLTRKGDATEVFRRRFAFDELPARRGFG